MKKLVASCMMVVMLSFAAGLIYAYDRPYLTPPGVPYDMGWICYSLCTDAPFGYSDEECREFVHEDDYPWLLSIILAVYAPQQAAQGTDIWGPCYPYPECQYEFPEE